MSTETSIFINPLTDFGFKYIFGRNADKDFTISFLNALKIGPKPITNVTFVDKENKGESKDDLEQLRALEMRRKNSLFSAKMRRIFGFFSANA